MPPRIFNDDTGFALFALELVIPAIHLFWRFSLPSMVFPFVCIRLRRVKTLMAIMQYWDFTKISQIKREDSIPPNIKEHPNTRRLE